MTQTIQLNGYNIYESFLSGYENLLLHKKHINDINVFPVPDGDTGNNMVSTFQYAIHGPRVSRSLTVTLNSIADRALSGARGNSGIILAQYLNGLADECEGKHTMSASEFGSALKNASERAYQALENPREGTLITVLRVWSEEMFRLGRLMHDFGEIFTRSIDAAREALEKTKSQLAELKKANVVDAGASGFLSFLEGVARMIVTGKRPSIRVARSNDNELGTDETIHDIAPIDGVISYRYCTEALFLRGGPKIESDGSLNGLRAVFGALGNSLVVSNGREKTRIHIHTNEPAAVFRALDGYGRILEQKVDDMVLQYNASHNRVGRVAIVTDSIADIPPELADRYQIHVIPQRILWGEEEYFDRLTMTPAMFYSLLDTRKEYPGSSVPDQRRVGQVFSWLASHYEAVAAIPVGKAMSGTWQAMENAAKVLRDSGYPIAVIDSKLNSAAQGLVVLSAARDSAEGKSLEEIEAHVSELIGKARIYVGVDTFKYMVRGGRVSATTGLIARFAHLKPIVSLDPEGKGKAWGASFSARGVRKKLLALAARERENISRYAVVHAGARELAESYAIELSVLLGKQPEYVMEISPVVGMHSGIGAVALAWI